MLAPVGATQIRSSGSAIFSLPYKKFWEHLSRYYDSIYGYPLVIKLARISLMLIPDTSCCERYVPQYNRLHNKSRFRLLLKTVRNALAILNCGPKSIKQFDPVRIVDMWMGLVGENGKPAETGGCIKRRGIVALAREVMKAAVSQRT